jgi:PAS domain S-box-containing protein
VTKPLRVLLVEDSEDDALLLLRALAHGGYSVTHARVDTEAGFRQELAAGGWDVIFCDFAMPGFDAPAALQALKESGVDLPFIIVSGTVGEENAVEALKAGAHDFLVKGQHARLLPALERELREAEVRRARHAAEQARRESEARYRQIVETAREGIWMLDAWGRTTYVNSRMAEMLGAEAGELAGKSLLEFVDVDGAPGLSEDLAGNVNAAGEPPEVKFRRVDGGEFWARVAANPIEDGAGRLVGSLAMVTDVTHQRKLQEQLLIADRLASMGMLAAAVTHEINNPLTVVMANLELAMEEVDHCLRAEPGTRWLGLRARLEDGVEAIRRVRTIVQDVKLFSRAPSQEVAPVDLHRVLESSVRMAWNEIRHRARLAWETSPAPAVEANESRLGQVFLNLLVNAAQAIPPGHAESNEIRIVIAPAAGNQVQVEIRDTGVGIPPEVMKHLFTPLFSTKPAGVGTGLGLTICRQIVESFGGKIEVRSEPGRGSAFRVLLRAAAAPVAEPARDVVIHAPPRRGAVLAVDDEPMITEAVQCSLEMEHDVVTTSNAREVVAWLRDGRRFDLILCDLMMPEMSGMELRREIQKIDGSQAERMLFLSGGAFTPEAEAFLKEVGEARLEKPFSPAALRNVVNQRLRELAAAVA